MNRLRPAVVQVVTDLRQRSFSSSVAEHRFALTVLGCMVFSALAVVAGVHHIDQDREILVKLQQAQARAQQAEANASAYADMESIALQLGTKPVTITGRMIIAVAPDSYQERN